jgi:hypothetical protein
MPNEYVIKGNAAILKCSIPSFVADFVQVISWIDDSGTEIITTEDYSSSKRPNILLPTQSNLSFYDFFMFKEDVNGPLTF